MIDRDGDAASRGSCCSFPGEGNAIELTVNTKLTITVEVEGKPVEYLSFVMGHHEYGVCVSVPQILQQEYALLAGTEFSAYMVFEDSLVEFDSHVVGYLAYPRCMVIAEPKDIRPKERRESRRLGVALTVSYVVKGKQPIGEQTVTIDVSSGGLRMATSRLLPRGAVMALFLQLGEETMSLLGRVIWSDWKGRNVMTGVEFVELPEKDQTALTYYLFSLERTMAQPKSPATPG